MLDEVFRSKLVNRIEWHEKKENVGVGDLVPDGSRKRDECQMALVEEVFPSGNNLVFKVRLERQRSLRKTNSEVMSNCNPTRARAIKTLVNLS